MKNKLSKYINLAFLENKYKIIFIEQKTELDEEKNKKNIKKNIIN